MTDTVTRLMGLIEAYRTAGGREEHWARKDALEAELVRLFTTTHPAPEGFYQGSIADMILKEKK